MVGNTNRTREEKARIVLEPLSNTASIAEICKKYNVASSAFYKWRDQFISAGTAGLEPRKSTAERALAKEISELKEHAILSSLYGVFHAVGT